MNKKTIIIIILAFVCIIGQAKVKSGLDLCLRSEATGEWLIGLFDDFAIYDCEYWEYAEAGKNHVMLVKDGQYKEIWLKKNTVTIDGKKYKTSVLASNFLPDYPSKDESAWSSGIHAEEDSITLRVYVRTEKTEADFESFINRMIDNKQISGYGKPDSQGRFELKMPLNGPTVIIIRNAFEHPLKHFFFGYLAVENGDTLLLYIDDVNERTYVMGGKYARFNNELLGSDFHPKFVVTNEFTIDSTITEQRRYMAECQTRLDSLNAARPNLSRRFRTYYKDDLQNQFAYPMLLKCCWPSGGESQSELLSKTEAELNPRQWTRSELPLMCRRDFTTNIGYYIAAQTDIKKPRLKDPSDFILQLHQEGKVQLTDEELQRIKIFQALLASKCGADTLNNTFRSDIIPILGKPLITQYWDWEQSEREVPLEVSVINSLDMDDASREILKAQTFMKEIDGKSHVASPRVMELAHQEVQHPQFIQAIDDANQHIADFMAESQHQKTEAQPKAGTPASLRVSDEELKDITDGKALFERIIAPFRGYVVYVDVWGTWCGPCRAAMERVPDLKKRLKEKPVVYLYFCNNSSEDAWRTFISQKHLDTDNAVHYNLPKAQEIAIEQYLEVSGFPTYRLVDTVGRLMPGAAPWPSNVSGVVSVIEQLLNP
ncbi:MAG: TlpA family protein disulfide reductase [Bacteroidaceae bacterium]|nr:TlpA family protein disulfide reductase [Bacteroidaceae bacterium]